jgi:hypothetical protein
MTADLRPCPFCGEPNPVERADRAYRCAECGATAPDGATWNRRVDTGDTARLDWLDIHGSHAEAIEHGWKLTWIDANDDERVTLGRLRAAVDAARRAP